jgi:hypothetical protein
MANTGRPRLRARTQALPHLIVRAALKAARKKPEG